jgi:hypothetical protein
LFNILGVWDIIKRGYILSFDENTMKLTAEPKIGKKSNYYAVNIIPNSVSESKEFIFDDMTDIYDIWCALINVYEYNNLVETKVKDSHLEKGDERE